MRWEWGRFYLEVLPKDSSSSCLKRGAPATILVVEDEAHIRRLIQVNLERQGYRVILASTGEEGLALVASDLPNLIVLDLTLPDLTMTDALDRLKRDPATMRIPIIALAGKKQDVSEYRNRAGGFDCFLTKPFNPMELIAIVKRIFRDLPADDRSDVWEERFPV
jgi:DNA-binding response OmpR family regulator